MAVPLPTSGAPAPAPVLAAEIIAAGSEMLTPFRLDTNSLFLTGELNRLGLVCRRKQIVGDHLGDLTQAIVGALSRADLVIVTGGLGPTEDDLTRPAAAAAAGVGLIPDAALAEGLRRHFAARGWAMPERNLRQAERLAGAEILPNPNGTAPGQWLLTASKALALLPGPPRELRPLVAAELLPRLQSWLSSRGRPPARLLTRALGIVGRGVSRVDEIAAPIYCRFPQIETTILASSPGEIELHLAAPAPCAADLEKLVAELSAALAPALFTTQGETLETVVGAGLRARGQTVSAAESCTGGGLQARLTAIPGASDYFPGGVVSYANAAKARELGVRAETLAVHGAVSGECAAEMAAGLRERWRVDWALAVTGIAGPGGGSEAKPVGTVYIALAGPAAWRPEPQVRHHHLGGERDRIRRWAATLALDQLRLALEASSTAS
ncbi:MAG: CinA family nicotinamide mononucleotide deamidase-related protein [Terriglobales bacterium]